MSELITEHEAITSEMERLRSERDLFKRIVDKSLHDEILKQKEIIKDLEDEVEKLEKNLIQAMTGHKPDDYSC